jgi:Glycosyltransferase family 92
MAGSKRAPYLSICAIYRDEAFYLREWIEFHRLVGVERFFLYNNLSIDEHLAVLAPYLDDGTVVLHDWPLSFMPQRPAYEHCLDRHREDSRWIAFIDLDEFLFSPTGKPVSEVLREYEEWPGVAVPWAMFGTSGHRQRPPGLVLENYMRRSSTSNMGEGPRWFHRFMYIKSIVDPKRTTGCESVHQFTYSSGHAVDENGQPVEGATTDSPSYERLRINHYYTKSEREFAVKLQRPTAGIAEVRGEVEERIKALDVFMNEELDQEITVYLPALRSALNA